MAAEEGPEETKISDRGIVTIVRHKNSYWSIGDDRLASYGAMVHGLTAADDRFGDEDFGNWQETAVDPRTTDSESVGG